jgi:peroxiredoxin
MVLTNSEQRLKTGSRAPGFSLNGVDGKIYSLENFEDGRALVVMFICNHCPYVLSKVAAIKKLHESYSPREVKFVAINSNNHPDYPQDSFENMQKFAKENHFAFPYLFDETQEIAKKYGATCTPDFFVFDTELNLIYHGRIDDATSPEQQPTKAELAHLLDDALMGRLPRKDFVPSMGCSIKWMG